MSVSDRPRMLSTGFPVFLIAWLLTFSPALSFGFNDKDFGTKFDERLSAEGQTWKVEQNDCGFHSQINSYVCRYNLENSIELDAVSKSESDSSKEVVMIWNGIDLFGGSFAYSIAVISVLCSPGVNFADIKSRIAAILPKPEEKNTSPESIPTRSVAVDGVEYTAKVMYNGFLMITVKDTR